MIGGHVSCHLKISLNNVFVLLVPDNKAVFKAFNEVRKNNACNEFRHTKRASKCVKNVKGVMV